MKRSRRLATTRSSKRRNLPAWASWTESASSAEELDRPKEELWLRLQAFDVVSKTIHQALERSLTETNNAFLEHVAELLRQCGRKGLDGTTPNNTKIQSQDGDPSTTTTGSDEPCLWKQFIIEENEPRYDTALPILLIDAPLEQPDRLLWMKHLSQQLTSQVNSERRLRFVENLDEYIQHRTTFDGDADDDDAIYMIRTVESARMFAKCVHELASESSDACIIALRPACVTLEPARWSVDVHVKYCSLPSTEVAIKEFWNQMIDFPLAVAKAPEGTFSSLSATVNHVLRSSANILAQEGSFWAAAPILPLSLVQRARSIHEPNTVVQMLPAVGCLPGEWNEETKKELLKRLVQRYNHLPPEVQQSARHSLYQSILWLHQTPTHHQLDRLILPQYDGDTAQPRRETVRALMETSIGEQWMEEALDMDPYSKRHLAVCGLGRVLKNGTFEKKAHVWCAGD